MSTERIPIPLLTGATASNRLAEMYNRGPGLASLINPPMTDPGGADDRAAMMEMQRSTFAPYLSVTSLKYFKSGSPSIKRVSEEASSLKSFEK